MYKTATFENSHQIESLKIMYEYVKLRLNEHTPH
jgi:hypothetical protein